jgi:hypothetical protein
MCGDMRARYSYVLCKQRVKVKAKLGWGEGEGASVLDHAIVRSVLTFFVMSQVRFHLDILSEFRRYECTVHVCMYDGSRVKFRTYSFLARQPFSSFCTGGISYPQNTAGIFKKSMGARHRGGIGFSYRPARLHRVAEFIPWHQFRGPINF